MSTDFAGNPRAADSIIRRFVAGSSRMALRQVREQLGGDAIILANRSVAGGVEVLAAGPGAVDALTRRATGTAATPTGLGHAVAQSGAHREAPLQPTPVAPGRSRLASLFSRRRHAQPPARSQAPVPIGQGAQAPRMQAAKASSFQADFAEELAAKFDDDRDPAPDGVTLSRPTSDAAHTRAVPVVETPGAMRRQPARAKLMHDMILAGFSPALARHIQERLPAGYSDGEARTWAEAVLCRNLPVAGEADALIAAGGVFALVGPTGVGKTTTVAKLAARFAMRHGVDQLALITTDGFRIGAQEQLRIYGRILGVAVHVIHDEAALTSALAHLKDKRLVLIDTAGLSQRDERVAGQVAMLRGAKARRLVVLNAAADAETLDHVVATFADRDAGCVITKTDEAARLGPVLDVVIRHRLRIHHVSTGQKVPEDLALPDGAMLVGQALARPAARSAFAVARDDAAPWMAAMVGCAKTLELSLDTAVAYPRPAGEAVHA